MHFTFLPQQIMKFKPQSVEYKQQIMAWISWFVKAKKWNALCKCIPTFLLDFPSERFAMTHYKWNNYLSHCVKVIVSSLQTGTLLYWVSMHPRKCKPINVPSGFSTLYTLISVTGSGHIKYKKKCLPYKIKDKTSSQSNPLRYMAICHIFYK